MRNSDTKSDERSDNNAKAQGAEMKDPMSGYASADAMASEADSARTAGEHADELKDPMSGYASADAMTRGTGAVQGDVDKVHAEEVKDSMSGYASADALAPGEE